MIKKIALIILIINIYALSNYVFAVTLVKPGDTGSITLPVKNSSLSAANMEGAVVQVTCPTYFIVKSSSLIGPQTISPGNAYQFKIDYEIKTDASDITIVVTLAVTTVTTNCIPTLWSVDQDFVIDTLPPNKVNTFYADPWDSAVYLTWENPTDTDFAGVRIKREEKSKNEKGEEILINGVSLILDNVKETRQIDTDVKNGIAYVYTIYVYDNAGNESTPVTVDCTPNGRDIILAIQVPMHHSLVLQADSKLGIDSTNDEDIENYKLGAISGTLFSEYNNYRQKNEVWKIKLCQDKQD